MDPLEVPRASMRAALDDVLLRSLRPICLTLAILFVVLAALAPVNNVGHEAFFLTQSILNSIALLGLYLAIGRWRPGPTWAHPIATLITAIALGGSVTQLVVQPDPIETVGFMLIALGVGLFFTAIPWLVATLGGVVLAWALAVWLAPPSPLHVPLATLLLQGVLVAIMIFVVRIRALVRMETLRARDERSVADLAAVNRELQSFSYTVSHDLRAPVRAIDHLSRILIEEQSDRLDDDGRDVLGRLRGETDRMGRLIEDILKLSRATGVEFQRAHTDLSALARDVLDELRRRDPSRSVDVLVASDIHVVGDARLLRVLLENLLGNAWKYTSAKAGARIEVGALPTEAGGKPTFFVRDNGAGFDMSRAGKLFQPFQRLHGEEFQGTGIGLATSQRIVQRHGGRLWAQSAPGEGATFYFTVGGA